MTLRSARIQQCPANPHPQGGRGLRRRFAFTLVELLVVMGVIAVLATLTLVSVRAITDNARLSSATNTVMAALDNARALAMKKNTIVLVVFRPRFEGNNKQVVEVITAKWTGESYLNLGPAVVDRFVPIPDVPVRSIPVGIKVAAPRYGPSTDEDDLWITQSHLPTIDPQPGVGEAPGKIIGIMYGPDGTTITRNSQSDSNTSFVDFNNNGLQEIGFDPNDQEDTNHEPFLAMAPFLAVFDDDEVREMFDTTAWEDINIRRADLTEYITQFADRIHFNRYTGVAMK